VSCCNEVSYAKTSQIGCTRNLTSCHYELKKIVSDDQDRLNFVSRLGTIALETETLIYAWALMTNHAHILLRSGPFGLPRYMRRLLSGYAISYNRRHRRHGHLFQNRYKSIVCEFKSIAGKVGGQSIKVGPVQVLWSFGVDGQDKKGLAGSGLCA